MTRRFKDLGLILVLCLTVALTACGGGGGGGGGGAVTNDPTKVTGGITGSGDEDAVEPISATLTATDGDGLSDGSVFEITSLASNGEAIIELDSGIWEYTPNPDFNGSDSFSVTITDDADNTFTQDISLTIYPVADSTDVTGVTDVTGKEDVVISATLTATDGDGLTNVSVFEITSLASNGEASIDQASGIWSYIPNDDFNGSDSFSVTITDDTGSSTLPQLINLTVTAEADISDDVVATTEDTPVTTDVLGNATFVGSPSISAITQGANGTVVNNGDGTLSYKPNLNWTGVDSYSYTVVSGGVTETATVTVTVDPVNDRTFVSDGTGGSGAEDALVPITATLIATDGDGLTNDSVFAIASAASNGTASIVDQASGAWSYKPNADYNGDDSFSVTITDDAGNTFIQPISLTITPVADDPTVTGATIVSGAEDADISATLTATDADGLSDGTIFTIASAASNGIVSIDHPAFGAWSYTPNEDFNGTDSFSVGITDDTDDTFIQIIDLTITPVADLTDVTGETEVTGNEDAAFSATLAANDGDGLTNDSVFEITGVASNGIATINPTSGAWSYIPNADFNGSDSFSVTITDDTGSSTSPPPFTLTVNAVADILDDTATTSENTPITTDVLDNDDFEGTPSISSVTQGANGAVVLNGDDSISYTPNLGWVGIDSYSYTVTSGGVDETATVTVTVEEKPYFAFSVSSGDNSISTYALGKDSGRLKFIAKADTGSDPLAVVVSAAGDQAFVVNGSSGDVSQFSIDAEGQLSLVATKAAVAGPTAVAISPDGLSLFVVNATDANISQLPVTGTLGTVTNSPIATGNDQTDIVVHPSGSTAYVANQTANSVTKFAIDSGGLLIDKADTATTDVAPRALAITPDGAHLYVIGIDNVAVSAVDAGGLLDSFSIQATVGTFLVDLAIDPTGSYLYLVDKFGAPGIYQYAIDSVTGTLTALSPAFVNTGAGTQPTSITIDPSGQFVYVADDFFDNIQKYAINAADGTLSSVVSETIPAFISPTAIVSSAGPAVYTPGDDFAYVSNYDSDSISQYRIGATGQLSAIVPAATLTALAGPNSITISPDRKYAYVVNQGNSTVDRFVINSDGTLDTKVTVVTNSITDFPWAIAIRPQNDFAYVTYQNQDQGELYSVAADGTLTASGTFFGTGSSPNFIVIDPLGRWAYVANFADDTVSQYIINQNDGSLAAIGAPSTVDGSGPLSLAIDPTGHYLYTANNDGTVGQFSMNQSSGALTSLGTSLTTISGDPTFVVVDRSGQYVYVNDSLNDLVYKFSIDPATGSLTEVASNTIATGVAPIALAISPSGDQLYSVNEDDETVSQFSVDSADGDLSSITTDIDAQLWPVHIITTGPWR